MCRTWYFDSLPAGSLKLDKNNRPGDLNLNSCFEGSSRSMEFQLLVAGGTAGGN